MEWYQKKVNQVLEELNTDPEKGLSSGEARARLDKWGPNSLAEQKKEPLILKFLKQFTEFIILVLIGAAAIAGALGEWVDALAIMGIVALNGVIGFIQEEKAEKVMEALKKLAAPNAKVLRDAGLTTLSTDKLVPGDIVVLESGDHIPADCRIIDSKFLRIQEAALTGESHPIEKEPDELENTLPLADRINMAYLGTNVVYGRGKAVIVGTGMNTEMGKIAKMLQEVKPEPTPLQKKLAEFGRFLVYAAGGICALIFALGIFRGEEILDMFLIAVSLAVAAIPEGLPAVVTIVLALGVQRMVKRHALIRKLPSVETLGSATIIASDKTGTLTQNQMTVRKLYLSSGETITVSGTGYEPTGRFSFGSDDVDANKNPALLQALKIGVLCNGAELKQNESWTVIGDPTEGALLSLGLKGGVSKMNAAKGFHFIGEIPFDAERKMMTTVFRGSDAHFAFVKGAAEMILPLCTHVLDGDSTRPITDRDRELILKNTENFSNEALRVLALAFRRTKERLDMHSVHNLEKDLVFTALAGMIDPPRQEVFSAVAKARSAGITPLMITGDHKATAVAIAKELGIFKDDDLAITGEELDRLSRDEFTRLLPKIKVYARVNPEHKLKVVRAWRERGEIIAMTGDGVNDAPALKEADIGVAMGITGTDVTKEAGDMVLTDDNFASIVSAVEEGRGIFDNIRRVVHFLLSCNVGEIFVLLIASLTGMPLPLLPVQILWTNLVTDGLPALGLAMEPIDPTVMERKPRRKDEGIVTTGLIWVMLLQGAFIALCTLGVYMLELYYFNSSLIKAQTMAFTVLVFCQKFHVFNCRSAWNSVFKIGVLSNNMLNLSVVIILASQFLVIYVPALQPIFKVVPLDIIDWTIVFAASIQPLVLMEIVKATWPKEKRR
ncbi:MAG: calcium-transporting P-type ATPase, PMR1-type [Deltaproteobacteria bacterium]|nr:calcium-transporting P-type ATPase, PMR1-type [Deltaproteobacteria bacterium]